MKSVGLSIRAATLATTALVTVILTPEWAGAEDIGAAIGLTPAAKGTVAGPIVLGTGVVQDETVSTAPNATLELEFLDKTHLALGPSSSVLLDQFVYSGAAKSKIVIGFTKGAFRFATGVAPKKSYTIDTPLAAIGVR